ncbi:rhodanese-like domain-containing protein [Actinotalea sp. BY-33]|uniref:Rhodanese-like domain-containing protein n=1 Tax=Actinotalea soli TaxID=2819234 RepID=A0A939LR36_9CELL|nr:rhodanese-like domain-containing protein [Actinotalea soli]MBO1752976.1 rhodanese-like domain-containing protein [Actinotalea soli]
MNDNTLREIDVATLREVLERHATAAPPGTPVSVIDVREDHEYATGHVPGAVSIPLTQFVDRVGEVTSLPGEVYVICESGGRSAQVTAWLSQQGHDVANVAGGTGAWRAAGYPVE